MDGPARGRDAGPACSGRERGRATACSGIAAAAGVNAANGEGAGSANDPKGEPPAGGAPKLGIAGAGGGKPPAAGAANIGAAAGGLAGGCTGGALRNGDTATGAASANGDAPCIEATGGLPALRNGEGAASAKGEPCGAGGAAGIEKGEAPAGIPPNDGWSAPSAFGGAMKFDGAGEVGVAAKAIAKGFSPPPAARSGPPNPGLPGSCRLGVGAKSFCVGIDGGTPSGRRGGSVPMGRLVGALALGAGATAKFCGAALMAAKGDGAPPGCSARKGEALRGAATGAAGAVEASFGMRTRRGSAGEMGT
jgi:hypothetical protein